MAIAFTLLSSAAIASNFDITKGKIKVKVNYTENPNQGDFFTSNEFEKYREIGSTEKLDGIWSGNYTLDRESIFWVAPLLDNNQVYDSIDFGPYGLNFKFNLIEKTILSSLEIIQEDITYSLVNIDIANDKQISYWTKAKNGDWFQVIRGKIFRVNENQLFTVFQTTVYEGKIPIYAFKGETILNRS